MNKSVELQMVEDAIVECRADGMADTDPHLARLLEVRDQYAGRTPLEQQLTDFSQGTTADTVEHGAGHRPAAGAKGGNQYGSYQVKSLSDKQKAFIDRLIAERDLSGMAHDLDLAAYRRGTLNKRHASDFIDTLLRQPELPKADQPKRVASEKAQAFVLNLIGQKDLAGTAYPNWTAETVAALTPAEASAAIDDLKALPKKPLGAKVDAAGAELTAGMYRVADGTMYRVYLGQQSGRLLAKKLVGSEAEGWSFEYAGLAQRFVSGADRMSLEEAKGWGKATGTCCMCARRLDVPESVDAGIGPVCAGRV